MARLGFCSYHPIAQLICLAAIFAVSFLSMSPIAIFVSLAFSFLYLLRYCGRAELTRILRLGAPLAVIVTILNPLLNQRGNVVLVTWLNRVITLEAVLYGLVSGLMLLCVMLWFSVFTSLLPGEKLRTLLGGGLSMTALVLTMTLRLVPMLIRRQQEISETLSLLTPPITKPQGIAARAKRFAHTITVLIASSLEESLDTARSMQARGYGVARRTQYRNERFTLRDTVVSSVAGILLAVSIAIYIKAGLSFSFFPVMSTVTVAGWQGVYYILLLLLSALPLICDGWEVLRWN